MRFIETITASAWNADLPQVQVARRVLSMVIAKDKVLHKNKWIKWNMYFSTCRVDCIITVVLYSLITHYFEKKS